MKFSPDRPYSDPDTAARKLLEITNAVEAVQDGRIHVKFTQADPDLIRLSKVHSVDQRMRLECGVGFQQLRTSHRARPRQLCADIVAKVEN